MNRKPRLLRRALAVAGAAFVGLTAAVALATPASAHDSSVAGVAQCDVETGEYVVEWTVTSRAPEKVDAFRLIAVEAAYTQGDQQKATEVEGIAVTDGDGYPHPTDKVLTGTHRVPGDSTEATLAVQAEWDNKFVEKEPVRGHVELAGDCAKETELLPRPHSTAKSDCEFLVVSLFNHPDADAAAKFVVTAGPAFGTTVTVAAGDEATVEVPKAAAVANGVSVVEQIIFYTMDFKYDDSDLDCEPLPVTGPRTGALAGGASALLAVGAGLFVIARRRRVRFSA
jgi:hypothetical protein